MPRLVPAPQLSRLRDDALCDLLASARTSLARSRWPESRKFRSAVIALEIELANRGVCDDAPVEPPFSLFLVPRGPKHARVALRRMTAAAAAHDPTAFRDALIMLDNENYEPAFELAKQFRQDVAAFAYLLRHVFLWIIAWKYDFDAALQILHETIGDLPVEEAIVQLEAHIQRALRSGAFHG